MNAVVIINPIAGKRLGIDPADVESAFTRAGVEARVEVTQHRRHARMIAGESDEETVVAVGGDGTIGEVINGMRREQALAVIPAGTANLLARSLGLPRSAKEIAKVLARGNVARMDLIEIETSSEKLLGHSVFSVGVDAAVVHAMSKHRKKNIRMMSYVPDILRQLSDYSWPRVHVRDETTGERRSAFTVIVNNVPYYGGPFRFSPSADPADGLMDVCVFHERGPSAVLRYMGAGLLRISDRLQDVEHFQTKALRIEAERPAPVEIDGDAAGFTPVRARLLPRALRVVTV